MFTTPEEAENAFYEAARRADLALMMQVWGEDDDIACIHPGGIRLVGRAAVQGSWEQIFSNGPLTIRPLRPVVIAGVMSSAHILVEHVSAITPEGIRAANCYATNIFHKGPTGWRMVLHHAASAPDEAGLFDLQDIPDILH
jgi:ketosteroid isomerase-like protein